MLRSDLCDFSDAYTVLTSICTKDANREFLGVRNRASAFKNNAPFTNCISKINIVLIDNAEDLDVVMPMYNLLEYNKKKERLSKKIQRLRKTLKLLFH